MRKKRIMAMLIAVATVLSLSLTVSAEGMTTETKLNSETVRVGNFDCWVENGCYYTEHDGETCQVINLDELTPRRASDADLLSSDQYLDWENRNVVYNIGYDDERVGLICIEDKDDYTPIYAGNPQGKIVSYQLRTEFFWRNMYDISFFTYDSDVEDWHEYRKNIYFGVGATKKVLLSGTVTKHTTKACIYFHKETSTGEKTFNYWFKVIKEDDG